MELIDKQKLRERLDYFETQYMGSASPYDHGIVFLSRNLLNDLDKCTFDDHSTQERLIQVEQDRDEWKSAHDRSARLFKKWKERVRLADRQEIRAMRAERQVNALLELLQYFVKRTAIDGSYIHTPEYAQARSIIAKLTQPYKAPINDARSRGDGCHVCIDGFIEVEGGRVICGCKLEGSKPHA